MIYKKYIYIFKKCETVFSEWIESEVVIICFKYLFINIDTQVTFANWSEPLVYTFSEFSEVSFCLDMFWE